MVSCSTSWASSRWPVRRSARVNTGRSNHRYNYSNAAASPCLARSSSVAGTSIAKAEVGVTVVRMRLRRKASQHKWGQG